MTADFRDELKKIRHALDEVLVATTVHTYADIQRTLWNRQLTMRQTMELLIKNPGMSFARYGAGELSLIIGEGELPAFQVYDEELRLDLISSWNDRSSELLIGFPHRVMSPYWSRVYSRTWDALSTILNLSLTVGNSHVTRPVFFSRDRAFAVEAWTKIFSHERVLFVHGRGSRNDLSSPLFESASLREEVLAPARDAYRNLAEIRRDSIAAFEETTATLCAVALGPAGTVLTKQLSERGMRAIDIGHLTASEEYSRGVGDWPDYRPIHKS